MTEEYVGEEFRLKPVALRSFPINFWTHGICVRVWRTSTGYPRWIRLRFPDATERSFHPDALLRIIPSYRNVP